MKIAVHVVVRSHRQNGKIHITHYSFAELEKIHSIFPGKYLNKAKNAIDFTNNGGTIMEDVFVTPYSRII